MDRHNQGPIAVDRAMLEDVIELMLQNKHKEAYELMRRIAYNSLGKILP